MTFNSNGNYIHLQLQQIKFGMNIMNMRDSRPLTLMNSSLRGAPTLVFGNDCHMGFGEFPMCSPQQKGPGFENTIILSIFSWEFDDLMGVAALKLVIDRR